MAKPIRRQLYWYQLRIGLVVIIVTVVAAVLVFFIDEVSATIEDRYTLYFHTLTTEALRPRAPVWLAGQRVGHVEALHFEPPTRAEAERLRVTLRVTREVQPFITAGAVAQVINSGLLGEAVVNVLPAGEPGTPLPEFAELAAARELNPDQVVEGLRTLADSLEPLAARWAEVERLARSRSGSLGRLMSDRQQLERWQRHLDELSATFAAVGSIADGLTGALAGRESRAALARIGSRIEELHDRWAQGGGSLGALGRDTTLAVRLERVSGRVETIRTRLRTGRGTAGRLLYDRALADELAELREMLGALRRDLGAALGDEEPPR